MIENSINYEKCVVTHKYFGSLALSPSALALMNMLVVLSSGGSVIISQT